MTYQLTKLLQQNTYPGRSIVLGKHKDGKHMVIAYFIMGRSVNSRNRIFVADGDGLRTQAHDPAKLSDPSLVIYAPVRVLNGVQIVTNGDQTDTIYDFMSQGKTFEEALRTRTFEPDPPIYTPRVSGIIENGNYKLSILKSADGNPSSVRRYFFEYTDPIAGQGHFIHTYRCDGTPVPSFEGEPEQVEIDGTLETGEFETRIVNKNQ